MPDSPTLYVPVPCAQCKGSGVQVNEEGNPGFSTAELGLCQTCKGGGKVLARLVPANCPGHRWMIPILLSDPIECALCGALRSVMDGC